MRPIALWLALWLVTQTSPMLPRPEILRIACVRVQTADLARARRFYAGVLGLSALRWDPRAGVAVFNINPRQRLIVTTRALSEHDDAFVDVGFETANLDGMRHWLASRGVTTAPAQPDPEAGGWALTLLDPDGHEVRLVEEHAPATFSAPAVSDFPISTQILHAGLSVRDAGAANRFYRDILGFSEIRRGGRADNGTNWIDMQVPDGTDYLEYAVTKPPGARQFGVDNHIALLVPDVKAALERIRERTLADDMNHMTYPRLGRTGHWELNLYDPDGNRIELAEPARARASIPVPPTSTRGAFSTFRVGTAPR